MTLLPPISSSIVHALPTHIRHTNDNPWNVSCSLRCRVTLTVIRSHMSKEQQRPFKTICVHADGSRTQYAINNTIIIIIHHRAVYRLYILYIIFCCSASSTSFAQRSTERSTRALSILLTVVIPIWTRRQSVERAACGRSNI